MIAIRDLSSDHGLCYQQPVNNSVNNSVNKLEITVNNYGYKSYSQLLSSYSHAYSQIAMNYNTLRYVDFRVIHIFTAPYNIY